MVLLTVPCGVREVSPPERADATRCDLETQKRTQAGDAENALGVAGGAGGGRQRLRGPGSRLRSESQTEGAAEGVRGRCRGSVWCQR